jgi:hypothetical protein
VYECTTRGLRRLVGHGLDNIDDQTKGSSDFEQGIDWMLIRGSNFAQFSKCLEYDENSAIVSILSS